MSEKVDLEAVKAWARRAREFHPFREGYAHEGVRHIEALVAEVEKLRVSLAGYVDFKVCSHCGNGEMCEDCHERYMCLHDEAYKALGRL